MINGKDSHRNQLDYVEESNALATLEPDYEFSMDPESFPSVNLISLP